MSTGLPSLLRWLDRLPSWATVLAGILLVGAIGVLDWATGRGIALSILYLAPVALVGWHCGRLAGLALSLVAASTWFVADVLAASEPISHVVAAWNASIRLGFFVVTTLLLTRLRGALEAERRAATTDWLTGASNSRAFHERLGRELRRRSAAVFSLAYIDLDSFKAVNDSRGHLAGDEVLREVAGTLRAAVRREDTVARLGGDEFALLFPGAGAEEAGALVARLQTELLATAARLDCGVTFSIGLVTFEGSPRDAVQAVHLADTAAYEIKRSTKGAIRHLRWSGDDPPLEAEGSGAEADR